MRGKIEDFGLIGDGRTAALVSRTGEIAWLCLPRFDSEACLAALLGGPDNGAWRLAPRAKVVETTRAYVGETLVLRTEVATRRGRVAITDFMPPHSAFPQVIRVVEGLAGQVAMVSELALRFDYGCTHPLVHRVDPGEAAAVAGPHAVTLYTSTDIAHRDRGLVSRFTVSEASASASPWRGDPPTWTPLHRSRRRPPWPAPGRAGCSGRAGSATPGRTAAK